MTNTIKAEFKKLLTVRSTYIISLIALLLTGFLSFYVQGYKADSLHNSLTASLFLAGSITHHANTIGIFGALIALLLFAHEYRYNTIVYTLTASNSRSKVLASKIIAVLGFVLVFSAFLTAINLGLTVAGLAAAGQHLPHQDINYLTFYGKVLFFSEGYALVGLLSAILIRNMLAAAVVILIVPNTVEGLLSLVLKHNSVYMPFTALSQVVQPPVIKNAIAAHPDVSSTGYLSAPRGALVFGAYLLGAWLIAWYVFLHRDAN
jgi:ABC-type transport system involved in multi-copper enzyme maturation permease subunit